jgi:HSP20 family protein
MRLTTFPLVSHDFDDALGRLFGPEFGALRAPAVPTDVFHANGQLVIRMDLPEVSPDDVDVTVHDGTLVVRGTRKFPFEEGDVRFVRRGTFTGEFEKRIALGKGLNHDDIEARYTNGVLELRIPHAEDARPKKIAVAFAGDDS